MMQRENRRLERKYIPFTLNDTELALLERIIERRPPCQKGELICHTDEHMSSLYIVLSGSFKAYTLSEEGQEQLTSFHQPGDIIGLDGIGQSKHREFVIALETSEICDVPLDKFEALSLRMPTLNKQFIRMLSDRIHNQKSYLINTERPARVAPLSDI